MGENRRGIIKKDEAIDILDRTIGFIENCDNKASIMLGIFAAIVALVFSTDGVVEIKRIVTIAIINKSFCSVLFLLFWGISFLTLIIGIYYFISTLTAKIDCADMVEENLELDSKIFFRNIAKNNTYIQYKAKLLGLSDIDLLNDLISQIYINSCICSKKFDKYALGLKLSTIGYGAFLVIWAIGSYMY